MSNPWIGISDEEFAELRRRFGDFVLEEPEWAQRLAVDLRRERGEPESDPVPARSTIH